METPVHARGPADLAAGRIVVTGASGLLGSAIVAELRRHHPVLALANTTSLPETVPLDLTLDASLATVADIPWGAMVHCAAHRSPDFCELHPEAAALLNTEVPRRLAEIAAARGAHLIHISTDYVFDGAGGPCTEASPPCPLNRYGVTKLEAERSVLAAWPAATVLRVPALYGEPPPPLVSPMVEEGVQAALADHDVAVDDRIIRVPTHTADVARAVGFLLTARVPGLVHVSAAQRVTRYGWACLIATLLGRGTAHILPTRTPQPDKAPRPVDVVLLTAKLRQLGGPVPRDCGERLPGLLARRRAQT